MLDHSHSLDQSQEDLSACHNPQIMRNSAGEIIQATARNIRRVVFVVTLGSLFQKGIRTANDLKAISKAGGDEVDGADDLTDVSHLCFA